MTRNELKQYLIDFETGKTMEFNLESTELLLMKDDKLYEEFVRLPRKQKKRIHSRKIKKRKNYLKMVKKLMRLNMY